MYRDRHCVNERYVFILLSSCFFACTRVGSLVQPGYHQLTFPPVKVNFSVLIHRESKKGATITIAACTNVRYSLLDR